MKRKTFKYPPIKSEPMVLRESASVLEEQELVVNVRSAKDQLSSLLEQASHGNEVIIVSDGKPKAKLVPVQPRRKPFRVDWELLRSLPVGRGAQAVDLVREDRDARG